MITALTMLGRVEIPAFWMPTTNGEEPAPGLEYVLASAHAREIERLP